MRRFFRQNLWLKLFSLILALVIWASVVARSPGVRRFQIPIEFDSGPDRVVMSYEPRLLDVRLSGDEAILERISGQGMYADVSVSQYSEGEQLITVVPNEIRQVPRGVSHIEVVTPQILVDIDVRETRVVPVEFDGMGQPPEGFEVRGVSIEPPEVEIAGPARLLESLSKIHTEIVPLAGSRTSFSTLVKLAPPDRHVRIEPSSVRVSVRIVETAVERVLSVPVEPSSGQWVFEPPAVEVSLQAPPTIMNQLEQALMARADTGDLPTEGGDVPVVLDWGDLRNEDIGRVRNVEIAPGRVRALPPTNGRN